MMKEFCIEFCMFERGIDVVYIVIDIVILN